MNQTKRRVTRTLLIGAVVVIAMAAMIRATGGEVGPYLLGAAFGSAVCGVVYALVRRQRQHTG